MPEPIHLVVDDALRSYIDPLTPDEHAALERSLLAEGCRDALVLWGDVLVDGHNRHAICQQHGLPFRTVQSSLFQSLEDVHLWMIDQHLGRRSVSDFQRGVLALRKKDIVAQRRTRQLAAPGLAGAAMGGEPGQFIQAAQAHQSHQASQASQAGGFSEASQASGDPAGAGDAPWHDTPPAAPHALRANSAAHAAQAVSAPPEPPLRSRDDIAKAARLSRAQVVMVETIQKQASPELVAAVRAGAISLSAAATVATLPLNEQVAAAVAGKDALKLAAKRVRDAKRKPDTSPDGAPVTAPSTTSAAASDPASQSMNPTASHAADPALLALQHRVAELTAENAALHQQVAALQAQLAGG